MDTERIAHISVRCFLVLLAVFLSCGFIFAAGQNVEIPLADTSTTLQAYAFSLLQGVVYGVAIFAGALLVMVLGITAYARGEPKRAWNYLLPLYVALNPLLKRSFLLISVGIAAWFSSSPDGVLHVTPPEAGSLGEALSRAIAAVWFMMYIGDVLHSLGFPPALPAQERFRASWSFRWIALVLGISLAFMPGPVWVGMIVTATIYFAFVARYTRSLAENNYAAAEVAEPFEESLGSKKEGPLSSEFLFITDLHITAGGAPRNEPEPPGNPRLKALAVEACGQRFNWLLIGGDLVDHGSEEEWVEAKQLLDELRQQKLFQHVVIAPGNHDLATAYNNFDALFSLQLAQGRQQVFPSVNGLMMRRYLRFAAMLEPEICNASGKRLGALMNVDLNADQQIMGAWKAAGGKEAGPDKLEELANNAFELYPDIPRWWWRDVMQRGSVAWYDELIAPVIWEKRWHDFFPLYVPDDEQKTLIVVLNSNAPDPTLIGSAWGALGEEQVTRLDGILQAASGQRVLLLCHHPPIRWMQAGDEKPRGIAQIKEWATHAILEKDLLLLKQCLHESGHANNSTVFLCGHRHGSTTGQTLMGQWSAGLIVEGASFAEQSTRLVRGGFTAHGKVIVEFL